MADEYNRFSFRKIAKSVIKANINFWGGDTAPYLNRMLDSIPEPKNFFDKYKVPMSDSGQINKSQKEMQKWINEINKREVAVANLKGAYMIAINNLIDIMGKLSLIGNTYGISIFTQTRIFNINQEIYSQSMNRGNDNKFYQINNNIRRNSAPMLKEYIASYETSITVVKELERQILTEMSNRNSAQRNYNNAFQLFNSITYRFKNKHGSR